MSVLNLFNMRRIRKNIIFTQHTKSLNLKKGGQNSLMINYKSLVRFEKINSLSSLQNSFQALHIKRSNCFGEVNKIKKVFCPRP